MTPPRESSRETTALTYRLEKIRALSSGVTETAGVTFLLLIAVRFFEASTTAKALIAAGGSIGLLLTPLTVTIVRARGWRLSHVVSFMSAVSAAGFFLSALVHEIHVYVAACMVSSASGMALVPLLTQIYQDNYPARDRGRLFSRTVMIRIAVAAAFSAAAGKALSANINRFPWVLLIFAVSAGLASYWFYRIPSGKLDYKKGAPVFHALRYLKEDRLFRWVLMSWMLMGFANLMMLPLRVEYLANPRYGLALTAVQVAIFTGVIPNIARFLLNPVWGRLFDRMDFFLLRSVLNLGFVLGILSFFTGDSMAGLVAGAVFFGISAAGGDIAWSLWVTKVAPASRVADYMSVHTFLNGIRSITAPLLSFHLAARYGVAVMGWTCAGIMLVATLMLIPEIKQWRISRPGAPLTEEISE